MNKLLQSLSALGVSATLVTPNLNAEATTNTEPQLKGEDGDLTHKIKIDGQVDTSKAGKYKVKYQVTDSDGAEKTSIRNIEVK
ncbi:DUF5011 domain-containing protein [Staphylococcus epidermidis]|nr:DUF5011 domain-containing protein [Staphylococcus epidermidis]